MGKFYKKVVNCCLRVKEMNKLELIEEKGVIKVCK